MESKLVKEIITTTTERYGDNGNVKEKITESREKVYSTAYTDEQIKNAEVVKREGENPPPASPKPEAKTQEDQIKEAAAAIDAQAKKPQEGAFAPWQAPGVPQYNVASRTPADPAAKAKFPWENQ